ncbi:hypothetical protein TPHA_0M00870 [Tetrapisispora phaffii CBS 4417]|uniref:Phospholipid/glycerol acyltransferase domain-containing protein n=1 Tax=Tetrapisispora phaffii (strain ATCC 24235 / CBS 4417 / NBRC 1672 / NRRL Y-8282 / UCD 70-5) TaxID=1071381 RepID=G8C0E7_TETPH|nr:hypothetical protein TPHA_0M00870 [Tetrapisispora phaffii CBS 4417]CCE65662.1 hypothetical protein TPHA_0M00870 [Tetrapisispora phaffii CBS 4417]
MSSPTRILKQYFISFISIICFLQGCGCIVLFQIVILTVYSKHENKLKLSLRKSKEAFIILLMCVMSVIAPSSIRITTDDKSMSLENFRFNKQLKHVESNLNQRSIFIANHQLYTDWIYLWKIAYTSNFGGDVYIFAKKALKKIPIFGYAMTNYNFIFLDRNWVKDKNIIIRKLISILNYSTISNKNENDASSRNLPYCFIIFPEGTTLCKKAEIRSMEYAKKLGRRNFKHIVTPHTKGLRLLLTSLDKNIEKIYDLTVGYSGLKYGTYGEDEYSLKQMIYHGKSPKLVDIHIKSIEVKDIPYQDEKQFQAWLFDLWEEKDKLLKGYYQLGHFDVDPNFSTTTIDPFKMTLKEVIIAAVFIIASGSIFFYLYSNINNLKISYIL